MLAVSANLAKDPAAARHYVSIRARALGCDIRDGSANGPGVDASPAPPPSTATPTAPSPSSAGGPPPLRVGTVYIYDNGVQRTEGLGAKAVAARVHAAPDGVHMVWWAQASDWTAADDVDAIKAELSKLG